ncbi:depolymerase [Alishewanella longhuensis]|uniref:Depolymerase n=1 Tax=Alishewanella longhuensis TaxID=1091037 RepID=A0ABQ3L269_9ALTE|nr:PHB depolymerase family esterase [Alishewanella longhuensis]GHG77198.1 depolymerase [Alishewanella longhuensis]
MHLASELPFNKCFNLLFISSILLNSVAFSAEALNDSASAAESLPSLNLASEITLSGLSSGAYMAGQYHQAFAEEVSGVAMLAAGPVYCAQNNLQQAIGHCMANPQSAPDLAAIEQTLTMLREQGLLAPLTAVVKSRVWILNGSADQTVLPQVGMALANQYANWLTPAQLNIVSDQPFAHHFPTDQPDLTPCDKSESPFLATCGYDAAGKFLSHLLNKTLTRAAVPSGQLYQLNQHQLAPASQGQLAEFGYAYIPAACQQGSLCQLHVSFHGCRQDASQIGAAYVTKTGLNAYADANQLVMLYPQVEKSTLNPFGCWDWWGYSGANYLSKEGAQLTAVKQLIDALR